MIEFVDFLFDNDSFKKNIHGKEVEYEIKTREKKIECTSCLKQYEPIDFLKFCKKKSWSNKKKEEIDDKEIFKINESLFNRIKPLLEKKKSLSNKEKEIEEINTLFISLFKFKYTSS